MSDPTPCLGIIESDDLPAVQRSTVGARLLWDLGSTEAEIAARLGLTEAAVAALPEMQGARLSSSHVARLERSQYQRAVGMSVTVEKVTRTGDVVAVTEQLPPDPTAGKALLAAHDRRYAGESAGDGGPRFVINIPSPMSTDEWLAWASRERTRTLDHVGPPGAGAPPGLASAATGSAPDPLAVPLADARVPSGE